MQKNFRSKGFIFVISAPSGCGKTVLAEALLKIDSNLKRSISVSTRPRRKDEVEKQDYFFISEYKYKKMVEADLLLEHEKVFGHFYGTPRKYIEEKLDQGKDVLCVIDWQGGVKIMKKLQQDVVSVFVLPPSLKELKKRLMGRATDSAEVINLRLSKAEREISKSVHYDYVIINDDFDRCVSQLQIILAAERLKRVRQDMTQLISEIEGE